MADGSGGSGPLRIGILGAARIAPLSIARPAAATGHRLVAVAARDVGRAREFAAEHGVERVHESYAAVVDDPEVEVVYNPLPTRCMRSGASARPRPASTCCRRSPPR